MGSRVAVESSRRKAQSSVAIENWVFAGCRVSGSFLLFAACAALAACADQTSHIISSSSPDSRYIGVIDFTTIDYSNQRAQHSSLVEKPTLPAYPGEASIGPINHSRIAPGQTVVEDPAATALIQKVIDRLLLKWPNLQPIYRIAIVRDSPTAPFLAESDTDGTMFFGLSFMEDMESTDELAFVVAHELAHVLLAHGVRATTQELINRGIQKFKGQLDTLGENSGVARSSMVKKLVPQQGRVSVPAQLVLNQLLEPAFTRQQEREADLLGADLMISAGYSPRAIAKVMSRLKDLEDRTGQALRKLEDEQNQKATEGGTSKIANSYKNLVNSPLTTLQSAFGNLLPEVLDEQIDPLKSTHPPAADRDRALTLYIRQCYALERMKQRRLEIDEYTVFKTSEAAEAKKESRSHGPGRRSRLQTG